MVEAGPAEGRAIIYAWLSGLFAAVPDAARIALMRSVAGRRFLRALAEEPGFAAAVADLTAVLDRDQTDADLASAVAGAHAGLFDGAYGPRRSVPPYRSTWTDPNARLFQDATAQMDEVLRRLDLRVAERFCEPPDHLAVHLAVLADLAAREATTTDPAERTALQTDQADLLAGHLCDWVPDFARAVSANDPVGFHTAAVRLVVAMIMLDAAELAPDTASTPIIAVLAPDPRVGGNGTR